MFPIIHLFGKDITTYFLLALAGAFAAGIVACRLARRRGENDNEVIIVMLFSAVGALLGSHILYGLTNLRYLPALFTAGSFSEFLRYANFIFGGGVFYGGLIGAVLAAYLTIRLRKLPLPVYADMLATVIPLFHSLARVGCFLGGCCYGIESAFGFTAHGNPLVPAVNDMSRFPVQLLEAALNLILFFALLAIYQKSMTHKNLQGKILFVYLMSYAGIRFFDEFLRGDEIRGFILGLSTSQFISVLLFCLSAAVLAVARIRKAGVDRRAGE